MKKIYFILAIVCSMFAFAACSDDDDTPGGDVCPVTDFSVRTPTLELGGTLTIAGKGFTEASKILLKDAAGKETALTVASASAEEITCTLPASGLALGQYTVVLRQGGDWELGKLTVLTLNPIKDYSYGSLVKAGKEFTIKGTGFTTYEIYLWPENEGDNLRLSGVREIEGGVAVTVPQDCPAGTYTLVVKQDGAEQELGMLQVIKGRLAKVESYEWKKPKGEEELVATLESTFTLKYDADGKVTEYDGSPVNRNGDHIIIQATEEEKEEGYTDTEITVDLQNGGRAVAVPDENDAPWNWTYNEAGFVDKGEMDGMEGMGQYYTYEGDVLKSIDEQYNFVTLITFDYGGTPILNNMGTDLFAVLIHNMGIQDYLPRYLGINGKVPAQLPVKAVGDDDTMVNYEFRYERNGDFVTKITIVDYTVPMENRDYSPYCVLTWE